MSRVLAFADTQIGVATVPLLEQRKVLDQIVQIALDRDIDFVVHGGDVFEGPVVMPEHMRHFIDATIPLRDRGIPLLVIRGNGRHDMAVRNVHALDFLRELPHTMVSDHPQGIMVKGVAVVTLPWVHPGNLIAHLNGSVDHDKINVTTERALVRIAAQHRASAPPNVPTMLLAHWAISGSALPSGLPVEDMREPILPWAELDALGFDIVVGAHIHQPQELSDPRLDGTLGFVCGSPQQLNFGEHGDHGCWLVDTDDIANAAQFIRIASPRFVTLDLDPDDYGMFEVTQGDYVRVRFTATEEQARQIDLASLRREILAAGAASVKVEPNIVRTARARATEITEQLAPVEALAQWCEANDVSPEMQHRIIGRFQEWQ